MIATGRQVVTMEIRSATADDLPALVAAMGQREFFTDRLASQENGFGLLLVAWIDADAIGRIYVRLEPAEEPEVREHLPGVPLIMDFLVLPEYRNNGFGALMLDHAEKMLRQRGCPRVALGVNHDNDAIRLYERRGYREWPHGPVKTSEDEFHIYVKDIHHS
jgi:ribosomal protein S18 acetylase RimI-like enzyme